MSISTWFRPNIHQNGLEIVGVKLLITFESIKIFASWHHRYMDTFLPKSTRIHIRIARINHLHPRTRSLPICSILGDYELRSRWRRLFHVSLIWWVFELLGFRVCSGNGSRWKVNFAVECELRRNWLFCVCVVGLRLNLHFLWLLGFDRCMHTQKLFDQMVSFLLLVAKQEWCKYEVYLSWMWC
jgi:hypothetical protein